MTTEYQNLLDAYDDLNDKYTALEAKLKTPWQYALKVTPPLDEKGFSKRVLVEMPGMETDTISIGRYVSHSECAPYWMADDYSAFEYTVMYWAELPKTKYE